MELKLEQITKQYGKKTVLQGISTTLSAGVYGLLGPNGAGKTTMISILIGILRADQGTVIFNGENIALLGTAYLDKIGYLPQYPIFYKNFRVDEFLKYMCAVKGIPQKQVKTRIEEVLELVNLTDAYRKKVGALSGGMRQRLGIAQAILNHPAILILDEPTAGLDPTERIRFRNIIARLGKDKLVLLATHIVSDVEYIAKEVLIINEGKLVLQGKVEQLEATIAGKVWHVLVEEAELEQWVEKYQVRNIKRQGAKFQLRIISDHRPEGEANLASPTLEDIFLSLFP
ncbi:ABC transporter ATP-binding protein [Paenibacillus yanchengensis]|uniref:ABC transporter ATP-binding protein n=1 Tax=Paenibacillus yanchengensis TaxID=2035833 RepID=A0ABW4YNN7_9BACL